MGLWDQTVSVSACSIGSINALLINQYDFETCYKLWMELSTKPMFKNINQYAPDYLLQFARESIMNDGVDFNPFLELVDGYINEETIRASHREIIITTYNQSTNLQEYHNLKNIPKGALINRVAASARLPFFKPVIINGDRYIDGGIGDNIPYYSELDETHFDILIIIKISYVPFFIPNKRIVNISADKEYLIKPSARIGSPLEFKSPSFEQKYQMGYKDAKKVFSTFEL